MIRAAALATFHPPAALRCGTWLAAAFALLCSPAVARPRPLAGERPRLTQAEYARLVGRVAARLRQAAKASAAGKPAEARLWAEGALAELPARAEVQAGPGEPPISVDNRDLISELREQVAGGPEGVRLAARVLQNLAQAGRVGAASGPTSAREALAAVLARREFRPSPFASVHKWFLRLVARIADWILRMMEAIFRHLGGLDLRVARGVGRAMLIALVVISGGLALSLVARLVLGAMAGRRGPGIAGPPQVEPRLPHQQWLDQADEAWRSQRYREAVRALHMAALIKLDEEGEISYASSHTDGRFARALRERGRDELAELLVAMNRLFAIVWYGSKPAGPEDYRQAREQWRRLQAMAAP